MSQVQTFSTTRPGTIPYYIPLLKKLDWKVCVCFAVAAVGVYFCIRALKHVFYIHPAQKELEKGMEVSPETLQKIGQLIPKILNHEMDGEIEWVRQGNGLIFKLPSVPGLIFKMHRPLTGQSFTFWENGNPRSKSVYGNDVTRAHFNSIIEGKKVCLENNLDLLVVPHAKLVEVQHENIRYTILAQEFIPHAQRESAQEEIWEKQAVRMTKVIQQLAIFTALMNLSAVTRADMPFIEFNGECRIAILDLKYREHAGVGFFGEVFLSRIGLIRCVFSDALIETVIDIARQRHIAPKEGTIEQIQQEAKADIETFYKIRAFHNSRGLTAENAREPFDIPAVKADFTDELSEIEIMNASRERERKQVTLEDTLKEVLIAINDAIKKTPDQASIRGKRCVGLELIDDYPVLGGYRNCGEPLGKSRSETLTSKEASRLWLHRVLQALVDHKYIYSFHAQPSGTFFHIQA